MFIVSMIIYYRKVDNSARILSRILPRIIRLSYLRPSRPLSIIPVNTLIPEKTPART